MKVKDYVGAVRLGKALKAGGYTFSKGTKFKAPLYQGDLLLSPTTLQCDRKRAHGS